MILKEFVEELNNCRDKGKFVEKHIIRKYCPVKEKIEYIDLILEKSIKQKEDFQYVDMVLNKVLITDLIIKLYTDIEIDLEDDVYAAYDLIIENGIANLVCQIIGESEVAEYMGINEMLISLP